ncbi:YjcZ family sporulation protein [Paenibacillus sp. N1-5-1-14]|nr:YjcZ family sporulation protein [Paenibacillus radicibacter]MCR8642492.1 YjcZ family sporulation protein [Paenibacillus radicibacter]
MGVLGGCGCGCDEVVEPVGRRSNTGTILVLFILLVIISCVFPCR